MRVQRYQALPTVVCGDRPVKLCTSD